MRTSRLDGRRLVVGLAAGAGVLLMARTALQRARLRNFFQERVVLITGGSRGLGLEMARVLAREGARLALVSRQPAELAWAEEELSETTGAEVLTIPADLNNPLHARLAVEETVNHFGRLDVLINNAGVIQVGPLEHMSPEDFEREMAIHFRAPLHTMLEALPHLRECGNGRIVNITSFGGLVAVPHMAPYSASKHALVGLSNAFRAEVARHGIRVTTVAPGPMVVGSHLRAEFKGNHEAEFAWFGNTAGLPVQSVPSDRAASMIVEACRRGDPELQIGLPSRLLVLANALLPNLVARGMQVMNALLPGPSTHPEADQARIGLELRPDVRNTPPLLRADRAGGHNHEQ